VKRVSKSGWIPAPCCLPVRDPGHVTRFPGSESRAWRPVSRFPRSPPLAPPAPPPVARLCSSASQLLSPSVTSHVRHRRLRLLTSGECVAFVRLHGPARRRSRPARRETSRFPRYKELTHVPGSSTTPDRCSRYRASLVLPSAVSTASASGRSNFRGSNGWPLRTPAGASDLPSRTSTHGSGSDVVR